MVLLYMPQFLVYTFPFSTLTSSSMVLGDMGSNNELLAMRSLGLERKKVYLPLIVLSLVLSVITFLTSDILQPYTSIIYKEKLGKLMADMPTLEIESNSTNSIGNIVISNGKADGNTIFDIVLFTKDEDDYDKTVVSKKGQLELIDSAYYVYSLLLDEPQILLRDINDNSSFAFTSSSSAIFYLDFSDQIPSLTSTSAVNLSSSELIENIKERNLIQKEDRLDYLIEKEDLLFELSSFFKDDKIALTNDEIESIDNIAIRYSSYNREPVNFYGQYYKSELAKKFALSIACFILTLLTLPLSNIRVKHGKMTGFAISLIIAVIYWYMLFGSQLLIFNVTFDPYIIIMIPDLVILLLAVFLLCLFKRG